MNRESLINKIYIKSPLSKDKSVKVFTKLFELIRESTKNDKCFEIKGFGIFKVERRNSQIISDFNRKIEVLLPPKDKIVFTPSDELLQKINTGK